MVSYRMVLICVGIALFVGALLVPLVSWLRRKWRYRPGWNSAKTVAPNGHPPKLRTAAKWIFAVVAILALIAVCIIFYPKMRSYFTTVDPCSACRPDEKTIGIDVVLDDGRITWNWSGPCVGAETCGKCNVKPKSCTTDNDTAFAVSKCACIGQ